MALSSNYLASAELYDPVADTWKAAASLTTAREGHTATLLGNGGVVVAVAVAPVSVLWRARSATIRWPTRGGRSGR